MFCGPLRLQGTMGSCRQMQIVLSQFAAVVLLSEEAGMQRDGALALSSQKGQKIGVHGAEDCKNSVFLPLASRT